MAEGCLSWSQGRVTSWLRRGPDFLIVKLKPSSVGPAFHLRDALLWWDQCPFFLSSEGDCKLHIGSGAGGGQGDRLFTLNKFVLPSIYDFIWQLYIEYTLCASCCEGYLLWRHKLSSGNLESDRDEMCRDCLLLTVVSTGWQQDAWHKEGALL